MGIVTAGVHNTLVLRSKRQVRLFTNWQRVHIGADSQQLARLAAANHRSQSIAVLHVVNLRDAKGFQIPHQLLTGVLFLPGKLRVLMIIAPAVKDIALRLFCCF